MSRWIAHKLFSKIHFCTVSRSASANLTKLEQCVDDLVPSYIKSAIDSQSSTDQSETFQELTPAQLFYQENKTLLLDRARQYYEQFQEHQSEEDAEWNLAKLQPVFRPPRNHKWGQSSSENLSLVTENTIEDIGLEQGQMPNINQFLSMLKQENIFDIQVLNLEECKRRDLGMYAIICSGETSSHCLQAGRKICRIVTSLSIPFVSRASYCVGSSNDPWILCHCGPVLIHIFTESCRKAYDIEEALLNPEQHYSSNGSEFPSYLEYDPNAPNPYLSRMGTSAPIVHDRTYQQFRIPDYPGSAEVLASVLQTHSESIATEYNTHPTEVQPTLSIDATRHELNENINVHEQQVNSVSLASSETQPQCSHLLSDKNAFLVSLHQQGRFNEEVTVELDLYI